MIDWIKSLFGKGKFRFEGVTTTGRRFTLKLDYVGDPNTVNEEELYRMVKNRVFVETGHRVQSVQLMGMTSEN